MRFPVVRIIRKDLQLKCFKRRRSQELTEANCTARKLLLIPESREVIAEERNKEDVSFCEYFFNGFNVGSVSYTHLTLPTILRV